MAVVICGMEDCKYRSKRKLKKWKFSDGRPCYGCTLEAINVRKIHDPDGDMEATIGKENTAICSEYKPIE